MNFLVSCFAGEGDSALSLGAFYGWLDWIKHLVDTVGLNPNGTNINLAVSIKRLRIPYMQLQ